MTRQASEQPWKVLLAVVIVGAVRHFPSRAWVVGRQIPCRLTLERLNCGDAPDRVRRPWRGDRALWLNRAHGGGFSR